MRVGSEDLEKRVEMRFHQNGEKGAYIGIRVSSSQAVRLKGESQREKKLIRLIQQDTMAILLSYRQNKSNVINLMIL